MSASRAQKQVRDHGSQPLARGILSVAFMPMLHYVIAWHIERQWKHLDIPRASQMTRQLFRQDRQIVQRCDDGCDSEKAGNGEPNPAADAFGLQRFFNHAVTGSARGDRQMSFVLKVFDA